MARACAKRLACPSLARVCDAHRWLNLWMKHQAKLKIATFDPKKEIVSVERKLVYLRLCRLLTISNHNQQRCALLYYTVRAPRG